MYPTEFSGSHIEFIRYCKIKALKTSYNATKGEQGSNRGANLNCGANLNRGAKLNSSAERDLIGENHIYITENCYNKYPGNICDNTKYLSNECEVDSPDTGHNSEWY